MPPWFEQFLRAVFYVPCPAHMENRKWCNLYCTDCMTPICSDCRDDAESIAAAASTSFYRFFFFFFLFLFFDLIRGLQVVRSSYQAAVQIDGTNRLGKLFGEEDDDIQVYRANRVRIYYLHSRGPSKAEAGRASPFLYGACSWPLLDADKRYFSISCKLSSCPRKNTAGSATISATLPSRTPSGSTATTSPASGARGISGRPSFQGDRPCFNRC
ncbi:uncharacterized protein LOC144710310 isoform X1 [Wolffia australiana]